MLEFTPEDVILTRSFRRALKTAPTKIRPITEADIAQIGSSFLDLEGREQRVEIGRYLCVGVQGERWTCSQKSMDERKAISDLDEEGYRLYIQRDPQPVLVTLVNEPFRLTMPDGDVWTSQAGAITWNGQHVDLIMRVVERSIFDQTYEFL